MNKTVKIFLKLKAKEIGKFLGILLSFVVILNFSYYIVYRWFQNIFNNNGSFFHNISFSISGIGYQCILGFVALIFLILVVGSYVAFILYPLALYNLFREEEIFNYGKQKSLILSTFIGVILWSI